MLVKEIWIHFHISWTRMLLMFYYTEWNHTCKIYSPTHTTSKITSFNNILGDIQFLKDFIGSKFIYNKLWINPSFLNLQVSGFFSIGLWVIRILDSFGNLWKQRKYLYGICLLYKKCNDCRIKSEKWQLIYVHFILLVVGSGLAYKNRKN
jgi:hypothetical protein